ncbi:unnamed protein product [Musa acuminata var. zebrina]
MVTSKGRGKACKQNQLLTVVNPLPVRCSLPVYLVVCFRAAERTVSFCSFFISWGLSISIPKQSCLLLGVVFCGRIRSCKISTAEARTAARFPLPLSLPRWDANKSGSCQQPLSAITAPDSQLWLYFGGTNKGKLGVWAERNRKDRILASLSSSAANNLSSLMESDQSWEFLSASYSGSKDIERKHVSECNNRVTVSMVSLDSILPDDVLEKIFSFLPIASLPQKPWYFMFTFNEAAAGYAYDPVLRKWYNIDLPCIEKSNWFVSSSNGLVCFMDNDTRSRIFVCNPIIRDWKRILEPPGVVFPDYSSLAISVDRSSHRYMIVVIKSKQVPDDFSQWDFSIHTYNSESESWESSINTVLSGWRGGDESVICNGVLYCLIHSTGVVGNADLRHRLMMYDISATTPHVSSMQVTIPVPCSLTCGRLINLKERLVMVGGIAKYDKPDIIKGIGIWELDAGKWVEVARVPHRFFQGFGELDDVFASSGTEDLIFIQSYGATALLVFDMSHKQWKWSAKCPVTKRFPLQLFTGFCFEPRLEMVS